MHFWFGCISIFSFVFAVIGFTFSLYFQPMAYWGPSGSLLMEWYWLGAFLAYFFSLLSLFLNYIKAKRANKKKLDIALIILSSFLICATVIWTSFIIIAWRSGM
ncbi:hypothetical protein [Cytobacillus horneckiae]|uniref:hypothetical protein n=1 Tax=Cytobacillus horneckiae TaxID=549687 RepID=UPI003B8A6708